MKKFLLILLIVVLVAAVGLGVFAWLSYRGVGHEAVSKPAVQVDGAQVYPMEYTWYAPVLGGLMHKELGSGTAGDDPTEADGGASDLGSLGEHFPQLGFPAGYATTFTLSRDGAVVYSGSPEDWHGEAQPGTYTLQALCEKPRGEDGEGYGSFSYLLTFTVEAPPEPEPEPQDEAIPDEPAFVAGRSELQQGDIFAMKVLYLPEGVTPSATTPLGSAVFTPVEQGWFAAVGIGNVREPGEYPISVTAGDYSWDVTVTVLPFEFDTQDLIIDESDPVISEANSPKAIQEYNDVMIPMYQTYDEERYWDGVFIQPTTGWISTQFGEIRYTNGDMSSGRPHWGMDIAAGEGTEVVAPNHGRVVFADYLLAVGYTVIIEHGGGLKSYYYHMSELATSEGTMVRQGDLIGKVGTTGYSTGPHLHYEMRLGGREQVISPSMLFEESAGLYSAGATIALQPEAEDEAA